MGKNMPLLLGERFYIFLTKVFVLNFFPLPSTTTCCIHGRRYV
jgi:hypothetical protein